MSTLVGLLAPDALQRGVDAVLAQLRTEVPAVDMPSARLRVTHLGTAVTCFVCFRMRHQDGTLGAEITRTWKGDVTEDGAIVWRW